MRRRGFFQGVRADGGGSRVRRRGRRAIAIAISIVAAIVATTVSSSGTAVRADVGGTQWWQSPDAKELTISLNASRNAYGMPTLPADGVLSYWAEVHASLLSQAGYLYHEDLAAIMRITGCHSVAENVGYASTVWQAHTALLNSPAHQRNMLGAWRLTGVGVATGRGYKWVVQLYCTW